MTCSQHLRSCVAALLLLSSGASTAAAITSAGVPAELTVRAISPTSLRVTLKPLTFEPAWPESPVLMEREWPEPAIRLRQIDGVLNYRIGSLYVIIRDNPLMVDVSTRDGRVVQNILFAEDGQVSFRLDDRPVLGLGEGGPAMGENWREEPLEFDRRGRLHEMVPAWHNKAYGSRNPVPLVIGTSGWALFVVSPWVQVDLRDSRRGTFVPWQPPGDAAADERALQGRPPPQSIVDGLFDFFIFDAADPTALMKDITRIAGSPVMPPKWALGYMQSHRTLKDDAQMIGIVDTFRAKKIPLDAVIYLGTGFAPRGWNTEQPSYDFNPEVFTRPPQAVIEDMHRRHVKVILHVVPFDQEQMPRLHGNIPARAGEIVDSSHIQNYWNVHVPLLEAGVDAFWPDEGDAFDLFSRLVRHKMYYQGPLSTRPDERPWSLHRNGYLGIARWGGWMWSGDTDAAWRTLQAQIMVGINHSLSLSPYWGSDIGGFYPNEELTGELYARWFQFAAFTPSFRAHGKTWWTRLPWGWGLDDMGPKEHDTNPLPSELGNPDIEKIARKYAELRYQLLPYNYSLAWQARESGLPLMRALWLHYPDDRSAVANSSEYLWGRDLLVAPVFRQGATTRDIYLPEGAWYDWWTGRRHEGKTTITREVDLETLPLYARAGSIIPVDPIRQYVGQNVSEPTTLRVYRGQDGEFTLYEDDGTTLDYLDGEMSLTHIVWDDAAATLTIEPAPAPRSDAKPATRPFILQVFPGNETRRVVYIGQPISVDFE